MSKSKNSKMLLASALKELMTKKKLKNITIQEICQVSNLNRRTFYYYFLDKQDLVNWIYKDEIIKSLSTVDPKKHWSEGTLVVLNGLKENKTFYLNALTTEGQNCFAECLFEETLKNFHTLINNLHNEKHFDSETYDFVTKFYAYSFTYMTIDWIKAGMVDTPEVFMHRLSEITDLGLLKFLDQQ